MFRKQLLSKQANFISVAAVAASLAFASVANAGLIDATTQVGGRSQHTLAEQWWQWVTPIAQSLNPVLDTTGAEGFRGNAALRGDTGGPFFLAGNSNATPVTRMVTVPHSTLLFFPILSTQNDNTNGPGLPPTTFSAQELLDGFGGFFEPANLALFLEINGAPVNPANLSAHRQTTSANAPYSNTYTSADSLTSFFGFDPAENTGIYPHTVFPVVADGYWAALDGLAPGSSLKIHFGASTKGGNSATLQDVTYILQATRYLSRRCCCCSA